MGVSKRTSGGVGTWREGRDAVAGWAARVLVPGAGPLAREPQPLEQMRDYLGWLDGLMREGAARGDDMTEVIRTPIPEGFASIRLARYELIRSVSHLYPLYERRALKRVDIKPH